MFKKDWTLLHIFYKDVYLPHSKCFKQSPNPKKNSSLKVTGPLMWVTIRDRARMSVMCVK